MSWWFDQAAQSGDASGPMRLFGERAVGDDGGAKLYVGLSRFYWLWGWKHERARVLQEMDEDGALGYRYARVLLQVGSLSSGDYWAGRVADYTWPDHEELVAGLCEAARARRFRLLCTLIGKGQDLHRQDRRRAYVERTANVLRKYPDAVFVTEIMNEPGIDGDITPSEIRELEWLVRERAPNLLTATGAVWTNGNTWFSGDAWARTQGQVGMCHLDRSPGHTEGTDGPWRQGWDIGLENRRWADNEPIGPGSSVASEERPLVLRSHRAVAFMCRAVGTCFHAKAGIRGDFPMAGTPGYGACPTAVRFLPGTLPNGQQINANTNYASRHWQLEDPWLRAATSNQRGIVRAYGVQVEGKQYTVPFGPVSEFELRARMPLRVVCYQQDVGDRLWERDVAAAESVRFSGTHPDYLLVSSRP